jgi:enamine deaminase RidA (YjgF/YER057c/UK114 family)
VTQGTDDPFGIKDVWNEVLGRRDGAADGIELEFTDEMAHVMLSRPGKFSYILIYALRRDTEAAGDRARLEPVHGDRTGAASPPHAGAGEDFTGELCDTVLAGLVALATVPPPLDEQGQVVAPGDVRAQMSQALRNLQAALEESGAAVRDVLKTTVYVASSDRGDLVTAWDEVAGFLAGHDAPGTLPGVTVLGYPGQLVEIEAIAVTPAR